MSILLPGGAGYIGSHTAVELLKQGKDIVIVDNFSNSNVKALEAIKEITGKDFKFYEIDYMDREKLEKVFLPTIHSMGRGVFKDCKSQAMIDLARERASEDRQWDTLERLVYTWLEGRYHLREDQPEEPIKQ